jgi:hypothetical protein
MATYVNDLRLKEIATGDESGTWGTSTNTNLELIAEAFSYGTEVITTNADTHTTTIADGSTDPGRSLYLKYTGTLDSACTITIGPNTVSKVWIIENGTSGSQDIILSQGSGANITIPAGDTKVVYSDGAGAGAAFFDAFASLSVVDLKVQDDLTVTDDASVGGDATITGTLGVTGNITGTLATAAQPNITSVGTLTGFTSTGIDDNADATAITIDSSENVALTGGLTLANSQYLSSTDASSNAPRMFGINAANTTYIGPIDAYAGGDVYYGVSANVANQAFYTAGSERLRIDSSGSVGIGTTTPFANQILNTSWSAGAPYGTVLAVTGNNTNDANWGHLLITDSTTTTGSGGTLRFGTGSISADINPFAGIDGYSEGSNYGGLKFLTRPTGGSATERMRIDSSGNVGIGDSSPVAPLTIKGRGTFSTNVGDFAMGNNLYYDSVSDRWERLTGNAGASVYLTGGMLAFYNTTAGGATGDAVTPSERMRINSVGEVLINCTSNSQTSDEGTKFVSNGRMFQVSTYSTSAQESLHMYSSGATAARFYVDWGGTIHATSTSISAISDQRLKENIVDLETGLTEVMALKPRRFDWKNGDKTNVAGFIAQEVETVLPDLIDGFKDNTIEDAKGVRMGDMIPTLVKAIQEQQTLIESLTARITTLEG